MKTNRLERALRAIPMGRKAWNFCWIEQGAKHASLRAASSPAVCMASTTYTYLVDVLQRVAQHPASRVAELTLRLWKRTSLPIPCNQTCTLSRASQYSRQFTAYLAVTVEAWFVSVPVCASRGKRGA